MDTAIENVVAENITSVDLTQLENLVAQNGEKLHETSDLLLHIYTAQLFVIGVVGACFVVFLLYRFLRKLY